MTSPYTDLISSILNVVVPTLATFRKIFPFLSAAQAICISSV